MEEIRNCLLCFSKCDDWILINSDKGFNLNVKEIILKHFWLEIQNDFPEAICSTCWKNVNNFHEFYILIENIHKSHNLKLKFIEDSIRNLSAIPDNINNKTTTNFIESIKRQAPMKIPEKVYITVNNLIKKEQPVMENDEYNYKIDECDIYNTGDDNNKHQNDISDNNEQDNDDNDDNDDDNEQDIDDDNEQDIDDDNEQDIDNDNEQDIDDYDDDDDDIYKLSPSPSPKTLNTQLEENTLKTSRNIIRKRKTPMYDYTQNNEKLRRYFIMECEVCEEQFTEFAEIKTHYCEKHEQEGYIKCCGTKYFKITKAMQHYEWHENSEAFKCESCGKCFSNKYQLKLHIVRRHTPASEMKFNCDLCEKSFGKKNFLTQHKKATHPREEDKIYNCDACGLKFAVKAFLRAHVKRVHEYGDSRVCDVCARYFKCSKSYDHHYLVQHTNTQHKVQCDLCGLWVKHAASLKRHMLRKHRTFKEQSCKTCGKTCASKKALDSHIRTVHNYIEYPCTVCEKLFKKKQTLKEHMAQHTGEKDLYKCSYCSRTFRSNANMYAHRKRAHPKEYEESRLLGKKYPD